MPFVNRKHIIFLFIIFLTVFLSNCQKNRVIKTHGIFYLKNRAVLLKVESSNRNDAIKILGKPHSKSIHEENTWIYIERTRTRGKLLKLGRNVLLNNNVLVLKFDKYGILEEKLFYDKKEMNEYKFAKAETKNIVRRGSFIQSFVSSLRQKMRTNAKK
ncbi:MAG: outer membrane protein assembly factor BamE [Pelagibacteraceae bacterium]|nr:outer membrane protein assembly factor BamE [Pelagibacteraceae bacterium]